MSTLSGNRGRPVSLRRRFFSLPTLLSFAVAAGVLYFLATGFDLSWGRTWESIRGMDPRLYLVAVFLYYVSFAFRGLRWRMLARNAGVLDTPGATLPSAALFSQMILIGWFVNAAVGFRLGDAYRANTLSGASNAGFSWSLGTVLAERVIDMATVLAMVIAGVAVYSASRDFGAVGYVVAAAFIMAFMLVALLVLMKGYGARLARFLPDRLEHAYRQFHEGTLGSLKQLPLLFALGLIAWLLEFGRLYFVVQALDLAVGVPLVLVASLGHAILSTVPTPGGVGAVEPGLTGLLVLALERNDAVAITLVDRSITYVSVIAFGGLAFLLWHVGQARRRRQEPVAPIGVPRRERVPGR